MKITEQGIWRSSKEIVEIDTGIVWGEHNLAWQIFSKALYFSLSLEMEQL